MRVQMSSSEGIRTDVTFPVMLLHINYTYIYIYTNLDTRVDEASLKVYNVRMRHELKVGRDYGIF